MKIEMTVRDSGSEIEFANGLRIQVPQILYAWRLLDSGGKEIFVNHTAGYFPMRESRYVTRPDLETRRRMGGDSYYDFGLRHPKTAMLEEILDTGSGLVTAPDFPQSLLHAAGQYIAVPKTLEWAPPKPAEPPPA
jgi:hypothetical protein